MGTSGSFRAACAAATAATALWAPDLLAAQPVATAETRAAPISQEQFLQLMGRLDALERRNSELEAEVARLKADAPAPARPSATAASADLANGRPTLTSADGRFTASLRGVVQLDAALYDQDRPGPLAADFRRGSLGSAEEADRARDLADGTNFRRMRLGVEGKAWGDWGYNLLVDFGGSGSEEPGKIINAYVEYTGFDPVTLRVGAFSPVTSFDDATSSNPLPFLERPSPADILRSLTGSDGRTAVAAFASGRRWSVYGAVSGNLAGQASFDEQVAVIGRATVLPLRSRDGLLHLGANANLILRPPAAGPDVDPPGASTPLRLRDRPEARVDGTRLIDTGPIDASGLEAYGLELGWQWKSLSMRAEHYWFEVQRRASPLPDPSFTGWYVLGAWTITGEPRRYNTQTGGFETPRVERPFSLASGHPGAWELAVRWSDTDLDYLAGAPGSAPAAGAVRGGEQKILSFSLNWYPNNNVRFLAGYQRVDVDRLSPGGTAFGPGASTPPAGAQIGQDLNIWSLRTQYAF